MRLAAGGGGGVAALADASREALGAFFFAVPGLPSWGSACFGLLVASLTVPCLVAGGGGAGDCFGGTVTKLRGNIP